MNAMVRVLEGAEAVKKDDPVDETKLDDASYLDLKGTIARLEGNDSLVKEIYAHFLDLVPKHISAMERLAVNCDVDGINREVMILRGLALDVGAYKICALTDEIERHLKLGSISTIERLVSRMKSEADNTLAVMSDYIFKSA